MSTPESWAAPDRRALARSPLVGVVWQLRYESTAALSDGASALGIKERLEAILGEALTLAPASVQQVGIQIVAGPQQERAQAMIAPGMTMPGQAWRLSNASASTHVTVGAASLAVETSQYGTWVRHFKRWVDAATATVAEVASPSIVLRVGMRYINAIFGSALDRAPFTRPEDLSEVAVPPLLGLIGDGSFLGIVDVYNGRHVFKLGDCSCQVSHALVASQDLEPQYGLLLDIDSFTDAAFAFTADGIGQVTERLHGVGLQVFQRCLTPSGWNALSPQPAAEGGADDANG
jgi:uncharacterized protein (TIGR04255 family)